MNTMSFDFQSRRSMVVGRRGMVATSNPLASQAGLAILRAGGNAAAGGRMVVAPLPALIKQPKAGLNCVKPEPALRIALSKVRDE